MGAAIFDYLEGDNNEKAYKVTDPDGEDSSDDGYGEDGDDDDDLEGEDDHIWLFRGWYTQIWY